MQTGARLEAFLGVTDLERAQAFYVDVLGLAVVESNGFSLVLDSDGTTVRVQRVEAAPGLPQTVLGWVVDDVVAAVEELRGKGVAFARYDGMDQDDHDVWSAPGGDRIAWFADPDGNVLSLAQLV